MPLEAEIISIEKPGENVNILVEYRDGEKVIGRETIQFFPNEKLDQTSLKAKIDIAGSRHILSEASNELAKSLVGQKYVVEFVPAIVPVTPIPPPAVDVKPVTP